MLPEYILRRQAEPGGARVIRPKLPVPDQTIFARIRKNPKMLISRNNQRAYDYQRALAQYVQAKRKAEILEKQSHKVSMSEWLHYKSKAINWRAKMDQIEFGMDYVMVED